MFLLPTIERPDEYVARCEHFRSIVEELTLTPFDRHQLWVNFTQDGTWREWPVPIRWWLRDPYYIGPQINVRPAIADVLADYFDPYGIAEVLVFVAGLGAGKSFGASVAINYVIYLLSCLRHPQLWLGQFPGVSISGDTEIVLMNASGAGLNQAGKIVFGDAFNKIMNAPYFQIDFPPFGARAGELQFDHRIRLSPGTRDPNTALGWNMWFYIIDEAAFGVDSSASGGQDYIEGLFNGFNNRRRSRWQRLGGGGLMTSPGGEHSFVEGLADQGEDDRTTMVRRITTWDAQEQVYSGVHGFLFDRHPDVTRVTAEGIEYIGVSDDAVWGLGKRADGSYVKWRLAPEPEVARAA